MNKGKLIFNGKDGWGYERDGKSYDLLEGMSLGGSTTSCICFVMETDENGYKDFTNWFFCDNSLSPAELLRVCDDYITGEPTPEKQLEELRKVMIKLKEENDRLRKIIESVKNAVE